MKTLINYLKNNLKYNYKYLLKKYSFLISFIGVILSSSLLMLDIIFNYNTTIIQILIGLTICMVLISDSIINNR